MGEQEGTLRKKLETARQWWRTTRILGGLGWILCTVLLLGLLCFHADRLWTLSASAREGWRIGIALSALVAFVMALLRPALRPLPDTDLAVQVERQYPVLKERLLSTISLAPAYASAGDTTFSRSMIAALASETVQAAATLDFRRAISSRPMFLALLSAGMTLLLLALHIAFAPGAFAVWLQRMANPRADIAPYASTRVWLTPEREVLPRGDGLNITIKTEGVAPNKALLRYREENDPKALWKTVELKPASALNPPASEPNKPSIASESKETKGTGTTANTQSFRYRIPALTQNIVLEATANDGRSNERHILVEDRPTILNMRLNLHYPAYMKRPDQMVAESTGNIAAPVGTDVQVIASANKPLQAAEFAREQEARRAWRIEAEKASGSVPVRKNGVYHLFLTDQRGFTNPDAPRYEIAALPDQTPTVQIEKPASDVELVPNGSIPLLARASDDYGVASMGLEYRVQQGDGPKAVARRTMNGTLGLPGPNGSKSASVAVRWSVADMRAKPGDSLQYTVTATDNDNLNGPHVGRSQSYRVRVVSLLEMQRRLKEQMDEEARALAQLRQRQIESQKQAQQARQKPNADALSRAQEAQRATAQETKALQQRAEQITQNLENNNLGTKSELQRRDQAAEALKALAEQKMPAAANSIPKAESADKKEALAKTDRQQNEIKREIERAQEMLSRTQTAEQLSQEAARLAQQQRRLAESADFLAKDLQAQREQTHQAEISQEQKDGLEMEKRQQEQTNADTKRLQEQLEKAAQSARERGKQEEARSLQKAADQLKRGNAQANQQKAQQSLQKQNPAAASKAQDKAADALQKAAEAAQQASSQSPEKSPQGAAQQLEQAAARLKEMAQQQKEIAQKAAQNPSAQESKELAKQERELQKQAAEAQKSVSASQSASQSLQNAQQNMSQASQQLGKNSPQSAKSPAQKAAQQLEKAAQQAQQAFQQIRQQRAAQEMGERIERLSQVQKGLQSATKRLNDRKEQGKLLDSEQRELEQVAARQSQLTQSTNEMARQMPSQTFQQAMRMAARQMQPAAANLNRRVPETGETTQSNQGKAARLLDTIARALKQEAQSGPQNEEQGGQNGQQGGGSAQQAQQAAALGELMLAQGLQQALREDTTQFDQNRNRNPNRTLSQKQQAEAQNLTEGQRDTENITRRAAEQMQEMPQVQQGAQEAARQMGQARQKLSQQETGKPTQTDQDNALQKLDQAVKQAQQELQKQQQQQQQQQQSQQGAPQPGQQPGQQPGKSITQLKPVQRGRLGAPDPRLGKGFGGLSSRAQRTLREGQGERVPAEYQDLVNRYYRSLAEKKR